MWAWPGIVLHYALWAQAIWYAAAIVVGLPMLIVGGIRAERHAAAVEEQWRRKELAHDAARLR